MTKTERSGHEQEEDDLLSPRGWRDQEWQNHLDVHLDAVVLVVLGSLLGAVQIKWALSMSASFAAGWPESGIAFGLLAVAFFTVHLGIKVWLHARHYSQHRRFPR